MVKTTESALKFTRISEDDLQHSRCIKLKDRTVYYMEKDNVLATNPNSCCKIMF